MGLEKLRENAKKVGAFCARHLQEALYIGGNFLIGYGAVAFVFDVTGVNKKLIGIQCRNAHHDGYQKGFNDGMKSATDIARVVAHPDPTTPIEMK